MSPTSRSSSSIWRARLVARRHERIASSGGWPMPRSVTWDRAAIKSASRSSAVVCLPLSSVAALLPPRLCWPLACKLLGCITHTRASWHVLGLIEDPALRTVYNSCRNFLAAVGREAVEEDGVVGGKAHEFFVHLVGSEPVFSLLCLVLLAHAGPHVGVDDPRAGCGFLGIFGQGRGGTKFFGQLHHVRIWSVPFKVGDGQFRSGQAAADSEGVGDVVAVADVGDPDAFQPSELFAHREEIREGLAGMMLIGEAIYDGCLGGVGELLDLLVVEGADHDGVYVAGEDAAGVRGGLALAHLYLLRAQGEGVSAELVHPDLEGDAGAVGGLLEDHRERPAAQRAVGYARLLQRLYLDGLVENESRFLRDELGEGEAVAAGERGGGRRSVV